MLLQPHGQLFMKDHVQKPNMKCVLELLQKKKQFDSQLIKKKTPTQVFSCEFLEIFRNVLFYRTAPEAASAPYGKQDQQY